ncbi:type I phosphomannose isomerase catalytic subunit [Granulicella sp. 5B5]|uniref:type I phosphomannose isomerase catalytic subunit n=1 Tax=Granulicella sp. 5B5 TaxID=1617967 RepID=UPI0021081A5C|nr:type I phosphomannose isomerase catalytic subunit [Granulicella sp. 5B5]
MNVLIQGVAPFRLKPLMVERVWGFHDLKPWYAYTSETAIGEAWLSGDKCVVETGPLAGKTLDAAAAAEPSLLGARRDGTAWEYFPLLIKYLFPKEKLSVQVHPDDAYAALFGGTTQAKTECWYVLQAEPDAGILLGLKPGTSKDDVRRAIGDGTLEQLMVRVPVAAGDMVYVSAGTMHALEPGAVILEIQQNSDTTYRLYDYGRPRELHLERGLEVLKLETDAGKVVPQSIAGGERLIQVPHFTVEKYALTSEALTVASKGAECLIALKGSGTASSAAGDVELVAGAAVIVPATVGQYSLRGDAEVVRAFVS